MWNKLEYALKDSPKLAGLLEECSDSKVMQNMLNGRTFKCDFCRGGFNMFPQSY